LALTDFYPQITQKGNRQPQKGTKSAKRNLTPEFVVVGVKLGALAANARSLFNFVSFVPFCGYLFPFCVICVICG
jgi:hypothetical protein